MAVTSPDRYALGRNSTVELYFREKTLQNGVYTYSLTYNVGFTICISEGSASLDTDNIDVPSNCQAGWRIKLPGLKSGTVSATGYVAATTDVNSYSILSKYNILQYLGESCRIRVIANVPEQGAMAFGLAWPAGALNASNGYFKTGSVSINPDDAVKISFSIELSGAQDVQGFVAAAAIA